MSFTLSRFLSNNQDIGIALLDYHLIFRQLLKAFLKDSKNCNFDPNRILVNDNNDIFTTRIDHSTQESEERPTFIQIFHRVNQNHPGFEELCQDYQLKQTDDIKNQLEEMYKTIFMLDSFEAIGYGAHSVVIHSKTKNPEYVFKYSKQLNTRENEIKKKFDIKIFFPTLRIPQRYFTSTKYYKNGTLTDYIKNNPQLTNKELIAKFQQICSEVQKIHEKNILLRDIKPDNILLDDDFNPVYTDFDVSAISTKAFDFTGTHFYMAPEVLMNQTNEAKYYKCGIESDIFSLGCVLNFMLNQNYPYTQYTPLMHPEIRELIARMRDPNPTNRPSIYEVIESCQILQNSFSENKSDEDEFGSIDYTQDDLLISHDIQSIYLPNHDDDTIFIKALNLIESIYMGYEGHIPDDVKREINNILCNFGITMLSDEFAFELQNRKISYNLDIYLKKLDYIKQQIV